MPRFWVWALPGTQAVVASAADVAQGVEPAKAGLAEAQAAVEEMEAGSPELPQRRGPAEAAVTWPMQRANGLAVELSRLRESRWASRDLEAEREEKMLASRSAVHSEAPGLALVVAAGCDTD